MIQLQYKMKNRPRENSVHLINNEMLTGLCRKRNKVHYDKPKRQIEQNNHLCIY